MCMTSKEANQLNAIEAQMKAFTKPNCSVYMYEGTFNEPSKSYAIDGVTLTKKKKGYIQGP